MWVAQVFRDRGMPAPSTDRIKCFLEHLSDQEWAIVANQLRAIEMGVEGSGVMSELKSRMDLAVPTAVATPAPTAIAQGELVGHGPEFEQKASLSKKAEPQKTKQPKPWFRDEGIHIYGGRAALKIELDALKSDEDETQRYTVQLEIAPAKAVRSYDWTRKIPFQFTKKELPMLAAVLLGYVPSLEIGNHGPENDKAISIVDQGTNLLVKVKQGAKTLMIPVEPADAHAWTMVCLLALKKNHPEIDGTLLLETVRRLSVGMLARPRR